MDLRYIPGATHLMAGASGSGKTYTVAEILMHKNDMFVNGAGIRNVVFFYNTWQNIYSRLNDLNVVNQWINKMPTNEEFVDAVSEHRDKGGSIVVIDDFMTEITRDLVEIVTVTSRHMNTSTFILFQSLFPPNPLARQISLNVKYIYVFKNPRENAQIGYLLRQVNPTDYKWMVGVYHQVTKKPYSALLIDLTQECPDSMRLRSSFLPSQLPMVVWRKKGASI